MMKNIDISKNNPTGAVSSRLYPACAARGGTGIINMNFPRWDNHFVETAKA